MSKKWYQVCLSRENAMIIKAACKLSSLTFESSQDGEKVVLSIFLAEKQVEKFDDLLSTLPD